MESTLKANSRMKKRQATRRDNDHQTLQNHEKRLVTRKQARIEATRELSDTIGASNKDGDSSCHKPNQKRFEQSRVDDVEVLWVPVTLWLLYAQKELGAGSGEESEGDELEDEAC